jgi:hypothetical protein
MLLIDPPVLHQDFLLKIISTQILETWMKIMEDLEKLQNFLNGVYAYFATLDISSLSPEFPYFIGNKYRSNTLKENSTLNQTFDFNNSNLLRNTLPYKVSDDYAKNDFV